MKGMYDDIIGLPHPEPRFHQRMSPMERAAQFAPFAALTGYDDVIKETSRSTIERLELDEESQNSINHALRAIEEAFPIKTPVCICRFMPDSHKKGGKYEKIEGRVKNIDASRHSLVMDSGLSISMDDIYELHILNHLEVD